jgi:ubiquinone/menaquinone biosynthesis C-methylase UbiE
MRPKVAEAEVTGGLGSHPWISRERLERLYWKMERVITPSLKYSQTVYEDALKANVNKEVRWLDLGCGHQILPTWRFEQEKRLAAGCSLIVGIDPDERSLRNHRSIPNLVQGDAAALPFAAESFDLVTANMVVEHLENPHPVFHEVHRVLRPGGRFLFHTPNARGYITKFGRLLPEKLKMTLIHKLEERRTEDVFRTFYRANEEKQIIRLARSSGFVSSEIRFIETCAVFMIVPPLAALELLWIRLLLTNPLRHWRTNLIVTLQKRGANFGQCEHRTP